MTLTATGLGIGTTNPLAGCVISDGANGVEISANVSSSTVSQITSYNRTSNAYSNFNFDAATTRFSISGSEKARIDSSGKLLVGTSTGTYGNDQRLKVQFTGGVTEYGVGLDALSLATGMTWIDFTSASGTVRGSVSWNGSAVAFNTSSDYRLKENIKPLVDASSRLLALKPCQYNFIEFPQKTVDGFIAHEAQAVVPECVTGEKDAVDDDGNPVYQGIDQSKLVPLLTAALQEAIAEINALKDRVIALEAA
jgi:hypothetical protein